VKERQPGAGGLAGGVQVVRDHHGVGFASRVRRSCSILGSAAARLSRLKIIRWKNAPPCGSSEYWSSETMFAHGRPAPSRPLPRCQSGRCPGRSARPGSGCPEMLGLASPAPHTSAERAPRGGRRASLPFGRRAGRHFSLQDRQAHCNPLLTSLARPVMY
jgi:hypothetical protein